MLPGKIAVVVGGHGGIGGAIAERFATEGATVYATSRRAEDGTWTLRPASCARAASMRQI
jgi:NAD(P)-dependent dehydrogenase (short-subunit alcohol dehydrogenase family)